MLNKLIVVGFLVLAGCGPDWGDCSTCKAGEQSAVSVDGGSVIPVVFIDIVNNNNNVVIVYDVDVVNNTSNSDSGHSSADSGTSSDAGTTTDAGVCDGGEKHEKDHDKCHWRRVCVEHHKCNGKVHNQCTKEAFECDED